MATPSNRCEAWGRPFGPELVSKGGPPAVLSGMPKYANYANRCHPRLAWAHLMPTAGVFTGCPGTRLIPGIVDLPEPEAPLRCQID